MTQTGKRHGAFACSLFAVCALARAQDAGLGTQQAAVARAIALWVEDLQAERLAPAGPLRAAAGLQPRYAAAARAAGLLSDSDVAALTHLDALQKLLFFAESNPDEAIADAVLGLASTGFDKSVVDRDAVVLRDLGHWALMRMEHAGVWYLLMRAAAGERPVLFAGTDEAPPVDPARRVAALKLLGMKGRPVFRVTIEAGLADVDPRVRLAAVEAIEVQRRPESLGVLGRMLGVERHPIVTQAVVRAVVAVMHAAGRDLPAEERTRAIRAAVNVFGLAGWRTDMDLIDFVEEFPDPSAVEPLIAVLERPVGDDQLERLVNSGASPLLKNRAWTCLCGLTGAMLPIDQPAQWHEFWLRERDHIVVPKVLAHKRTGGSTVSTFFGIPVTGREIAFLIDTSGSMKEKVGDLTTADPAARRDPRLPSRLAAAKEQLLQAVQVMPPESRYHLLTFASDVREWSRKAVPPTPTATRSLVELLSRLQADGGTNVYDGLVQALALDQLFFGQQGKVAIDELFLLSDGEPTTGAIQDPDELLRLVKDSNRYLHVRINTVFTGRGKGADFLRQLAEQNDGVFVQR